MNQLNISSEEQLNQLSNINSLDDIIIEYNDILCKFLKTLYFCPHDSEYRLTHKDEDDDDIRNLLGKILIYQKNYHLNDKVYVYCKNYFKLNDYFYKDKNIYAGTQYFVVSKSEFHNFCKQKLLKFDDFIASSFSWDSNRIDATTFMEWMNRQHNYEYQLPYTIDITCSKTADEFGHNYGNRVNIFKDMQFINVLKLKDYL